jgi:DNA-binding NarL/FixJ family response regulator
MVASLLDRLTVREREVLETLAHGLSNRKIARHLAVSEKTIKNHLSSIFRKIEVIDRTQAAIYAYRCGLGAGADTNIP